MDKKVRKKLRNLVKNFDFKKNELGEIEKMYSGEFFNVQDAGYLKLLQKSKELCEKYSSVCNEEIAKKRKYKKLKLPLFSYLKFYFKKSRLLKLLFPIHGFVLYAEDKIEAVIGLVDLKGYGFINREVRFTPNSLVKVEKSNIFALDIEVGSQEMEKSENLSRLTRITIEKNCWICGGIKILKPCRIEKNSVLAAGAFVEESFPENSLIAGRPAKLLKVIDENYQSTRVMAFKLSNEQKGKIICHIKKFNHGKCPMEYIKMLNGEVFNSMSKSLSFLYGLTRTLCNEYGLESTSQERKEEILNILFPNHGKNFVVEENLYLDMIGTVTVGDNVTIKKNVKLGGNIILQNNSTIGKGCLLFASGHSVKPNERSMKFSFKKGFYEDTQYDFIKVRENTVIGDHTVVCPNSIVEKSVPDNSLYVKNKIV